MLANLYASQSRAHAVNTRIALAMTKKLHLLVTDYYAKMCHYAGELTAIGAPLRDDELVTYILASLDEDYNSVFTEIVARTDPISPSELYSQLLSFEQHVSLQAHHMSGSCSSAMAPTRGRVSSGGRGYGSYDRGRGRVAQVVVTHQMEAHHGHSAGCALNLGTLPIIVGIVLKKDYVPEQRTLAATSSTGADPAWYMDLGATDHITSDLDHFTMHDPYTGHDQVHAANGSGMGITCIGTSIIPTTTPPPPLPLPMSFMFPPLIRTLFPFIVLLLIMISLLSFTPISS
jgi:hypothetical protein